MMIYTSGSVETAKGVVFSHKNIIAQINAMLDSWGWNRQVSVLQQILNTWSPLDAQALSLTVSWDYGA